MNGREQSLLMINVDELWLKGKNRPLYFKTLVQNVRAKIKATVRSPFSLNNQNQRIIYSAEQLPEDSLIEAICEVPGVHSVIPSHRISRDRSEDVADSEKRLLDEFLKITEEMALDELSFKIETQRVDKTYPKRSMDFSAFFGGEILKSRPLWRVSVKRPEHVFHIKIMGDCFYLATKKYYGMGGLPVKTNGHLMTMISGGFDSPVASYLMSKRGCQQTFVFFHAKPFVGDEVVKKIIQLVARLAHFQTGAQLIIIPFGDIQKAIAKTCSQEYRTSFFRSYMIKVANKLASHYKAQALLVGDSLGQVSSQTIDNIQMLDSSSELPIFRPLIGLNKREILELAENIGTHDISLIPHDDACQLFAPKHPIIRPSRHYWEKYHNEYSWGELIDEAVKKREIIGFDAQGRQFHEGMKR